MNVRDILREHQEATDCDDSHLLNILCEFLDREPREPHRRVMMHNRLYDYVVQRLERLPGDVS